MAALMCTTFVSLELRLGTAFVDGNATARSPSRSPSDTDVGVDDPRTKT